MIVVRAPFRISLFGGGTDLPHFFKVEPGAVLSFTIQEYVYIMLNDRFGGGYRISYSKTEDVQNIEEIQHDIVRNALKLIKHPNEHGLEIVCSSDVSMKGSGMGASSSFAVALMMALLSKRELKHDSKTLASVAAHIEMRMCNKPIGLQDAVASAYGGLNLLEFSPEAVEVHSVEEAEHRLEQRIFEELMPKLLILYIGERGMSTNEILSQPATPDAKIIRDMADLARVAYADCLERDTSDFGLYLEEGWKLKKLLTPLATNDLIDNLHDIALSNGASGFKPLGAGQGGFALCYVDSPEDRSRIIQATGLTEMHFEPECQPVVGPLILWSD